MYRVGHADLTKFGVNDRETLSLDWDYMLNKAVDNLHKCLWVGILEDIDKSLNMLSHQTGLNLQLEYLRTNKEKPAQDHVSETEIEKIKSLMPMDLYFYEYAKQLHEHRWKMFSKQQHNTKKRFSALPAVLDGCKSTRYQLNCPTFKYQYRGSVRNIAPGVDTLCNLLCNIPYLLDFNLHFHNLI